MNVIKEKSIKWISHIDERSNGFFSLGIAKKTNNPVIVLTTSGTATANLLPSIIEAYYSMTPLIIITADRPKKLINTGENQTINQVGIYKNFIRQMIDIKISNQISTLKKINKMKKNKLAIAGLGRIGKIHLENILQVNEVDVVAAIDFYPESLQFAFKKGVKNLYTSYHYMIQKESIYAVVTLFSSMSSIISW